MSLMDKIRKKSNKDDSPSVSSPSPTSSTPAPSTYMKILKDYSILMEYKKLKEQAPTGVYVLPSPDSLRQWHGVIFVRKGHYRGGVFRFVLALPSSYPSSAPKVTFTSKMFHPLVDEHGVLDMSPAFPTWSPQHHYIVLLLCYIKKAFYKSELWAVHYGGNTKAQQMWLADKTQFFNMVDRCVAASIKRVYESDDRCPLKFEAPRPVHEEVFRRIITGEHDANYADWFADGVARVDDASAGTFREQEKEKERANVSSL